jgi:hypothetical protein
VWAQTTPTSDKSRTAFCFFSVPLAELENEYTLSLGLMRLGFRDSPSSKSSICFWLLKDKHKTGLRLLFTKKLDKLKNLKYMEWTQIVQRLSV